mgnify:CR=1 FL=1
MSNCKCDKNKPVNCHDDPLPQPPICNDKLKTQDLKQLFYSNGNDVLVFPGNNFLGFGSLLNVNSAYIPLSADMTIKAVNFEGVNTNNPTQNPVAPILRLWVIKSGSSPSNLYEKTMTVVPPTLPGAPTLYTVKVSNLNLKLKSGQKLAVEIASSNFNGQNISYAAGSIAYC